MHLLTSHLPHGLVASFQSTLEVAGEAELLLIVGDASHPHMDEHLEIVSETLKDIEADEVPSILILNKCDTPRAREVLGDLRMIHPAAICVSALRKHGLPQLKTAIDARIFQNVTPASAINRQPSPTS